jgi:hypothetical protein
MIGINVVKELHGMLLLAPNVAVRWTELLLCTQEVSVLNFSTEIDSTN